VTPDRLPADGSLHQPDQRSCGPSALVVARLLLDERYADSVLPGGAVLFRSEVLDLHQRVTRPVLAGRLQLPWPRALGTPPWAVARDLSLLPPPTRSRARLVLRRRSAYDRVGAALRRGRPVPLYVGSRWLPRHVVLVVGTLGDGLQLYDPAAGRVVEETRAAFETRRLRLSGWDRPWIAVLPV
jgi:hypothetical protein